jgi:hypothetical protein
MSQSYSPGPGGFFESIKNAILNPESLGEFIFDGVLSAALFIGFPIAIAVEIFSLIIS